MNIILKHIGRNIRENKFRSSIMVFIVLLSTTVSYVVFNLQDMITYNYDKVYNASAGEANIVIRQNDANSPYIPENLNLEHVTVEKRSDIYGLTGKFSEGTFISKAVLIGLDIDAYRSMDAVSLLNTQHTFTLDYGECVISKRSADKYSLSAGDLVSVTVDGIGYPFRVAAIAETNRTFYEEKGNFQLLIPLKNANEIGQTSGMVTKTRLKVDSGSVDISDVVNRLQTQNSGFVISEKEDFETLHYQLSAVSSVMFVVVMIVILISAYILFSLVKLIMVDRLPVIGTFRSMGADRTKIVLVLLLEFLSYGGIGTILGFMAAIPTLPVIAGLFNQYKEFGVVTEVRHGLGYAVAAACIGLFLPALSALFCIIKTSRIPLKNMILKPSPKSYETSFKKIIISSSLLILSAALFLLNQSDDVVLGIAGLISLICGAAFLTPIVMTVIADLFAKCNPKGSCAMGLKNLKSNHTVRSNSSMFVVLILIVLMMATLTDGIKNIAVADISNIGYDVIVTLNGEKEIKAADLQGTTGIGGAMDSYETMWYGSYGPGVSRVYGVNQFNELKEYMQGLNYESYELDTNLQGVEHGIIIDQYWARVQRLSIGDVLTMYADKKRRVKIGDFTVAGFWDSSKGTTDRAFVAIGLADYKDMLSDSPEKILVKATSADKAAQQLSETYIDKKLSVVTMNDFLSEQLTAIDTMIGILFASVLLGSAILVFGVICNLIVSFIQRKREYAVMYSVCMSKQQLISMLLWEMVFSCIAIWMVSAVSGFALTKILTKATSGMGMVIDFQFNFGLLLGVVFSVLIIQAAVTTFPIRKLGQLNVMEELKYE